MKSIKSPRSPRSPGILSKTSSRNATIMFGQNDNEINFQALERVLASEDISESDFKHGRLAGKHFRT